ncbi:MAG: SCO1664 family protein [Acidimicrobiales bacterium]
MPPQQRPPSPLTVLAEGSIAVTGRLPWSSNATFLTSVALGGTTLAAVYKPLRGERPLWDFPGGLYTREVAAYRVSEALGWRRVPETIARDDGPLGPGSLQRFVPSDFTQHYFTLIDNVAHHDALRTIAVLDLVLNNADRKAGHCLLGNDGQVWAIDNGLSFHVAPKLRTVIWDFAGDEVPAALASDLERLVAAPPDLNGLIGEAERAALVRRAAAVARMGTLPDPDPERRPYPWPMV